MKIVVMSQNRIEEYARTSNSETSILISITSHCGRQADVHMNENNKILNTLFLRFDDTDRKEMDLGITHIDARKIIEFIKKNLGNGNVDKIIVNCEAGQSRSAGVAAALMKYLNNDDTPIFDNPRYTPNMLCYRTVLDMVYYMEYRENRKRMREGFGDA